MKLKLTENDPYDITTQTGLIRSCSNSRNVNMHAQTLKTKETPRHESIPIQNNFIYRQIVEKS